LSKLGARSTSTKGVQQIELLYYAIDEESGDAAAMEVPRAPDKDRMMVEVALMAQTA
jgi:hypothetical protein